SGDRLELLHFPAVDGDLRSFLGHPDRQSFSDPLGTPRHHDNLSLDVIAVQSHRFPSRVESIGSTFERPVVSREVTLSFSRNICPKERSYGTPSFLFPPAI